MNLPNKLTLLRLILIPFFIAAFYLGFFAGHYFVALGIFVVASLTDFLDGYIARKYNMVTDLGKFLDPIADKVLVLAGLIVLIADPYETNVFGRIGIIGIIYGGVGVSIIMAREMVVSSLRMMAAKKGIVLAAEMTGKVKTFFTDVTIIVLLLAGDLLNFAPDVGIVFDYIGLACFGISVLLTIISGCSYLIKNKEVFKG
ncbi:MAG: CDP-diacylglycerol--glycerol-3-phosphate 3-phosphatidyltransferase [Clostridia bacterium]|nr:CDP-diacylglycerol--glycerol-3-phosphate 3-phosphatidyltransferase [Clostridia bacterium]